MKVELLPLGAVPRDVIRRLADRLAAYGVVGERLEGIGLPPDASVKATEQYDADGILARLAAHPHDSTLLAVTDADLASGRFNFVFGLADSEERVAVVSTYRLGREGDSLLEERLVKEALHEVGHTLGLSHCVNTGCVMQFSSSLADTDAKGHRFCERCSGRIPLTGIGRL
ncbi:MAG TPA: archaemetzincin family Zn-dependent metalloprotease [Thermoplasmata archaeon]|nr:archaemetzincin family Zn-dependent metalloprotease [Thermoplasmata archaeon]